MTSSQPDQEPVITRAEGFRDIYANHIRFESSIWDVRMLLGLLDQSTTPATIHHHTSVNIPWYHAKLTAYYLLLHVWVNEAMNGPIRVPDVVVPPPIESVFPEIERHPELFARIQALRAVLFPQ